MGFGIDHSVRLRALVVDGDVETATTLSYLLQVVGCKAGVAFGASMATRVGELFQPSLVLLDLAVLDESGGELVQALRALEGPVAKAVFVCLAAEADCEAAQRWLAAGCDRVFCKPLQPHLLAELLAQAQAEVEVQSYRVKEGGGQSSWDSGADGSASHP